MRKRRVRSPSVVHDKAWHDAQMAKGFYNRFSGEYVTWDYLRETACTVYEHGFDDIPYHHKVMEWYDGDGTQPIRTNRRGNQTQTRGVKRDGNY